MRCVCRKTLTVLLCAVFLCAGVFAGQNEADAESVFERHEVFSYEASRLVQRLQEGRHLLVISGSMDSYMLGNLRNAIIANTGISVALDLSSVTALFDIHKEAFNGCKNLVSVTIPDGAMQIRWQCFLGCENLTAINATENNDYFSSSDGILYSKDGTELVICPCGWQGSVEIPLLVSAVREGAFSNCPNVTSFSLQTRAEEYQQDGEVRTRVIENDTFSVLDGILYSKDMTVLVQFPGGRSGEVLVPATVKEIAPRAFAYCSRITSVEVPSGASTFRFSSRRTCSATPTAEKGLKRGSSRARSRTPAR